MPKGVQVQVQPSAPEPYTRLHTRVYAKMSLLPHHRFREDVTLRKKRERERKKYDFYGGLSYWNRRNNTEPDKHVLALRVNSDSIHRVYLLIDAFIRTLESLDCRVVVDKDDTDISIHTI